MSTRSMQMAKDSVALRISFERTLDPKAFRALLLYRARDASYVHNTTSIPMKADHKAGHGESSQEMRQASTRDAAGLRRNA